MFETGAGGEGGGYFSVIIVDSKNNIMSKLRTVTNVLIVFVSLNEKLLLRFQTKVFHTKNYYVQRSEVYAEMVHCFALKMKIN